MDKALTLKDVEKHLIKTFVSAILLAVLGSIGTSFAFYYNTNSSIDKLNESKISTNADVSTLKRDVSEINANLSELKVAIMGTEMYKNYNGEQVKKLEDRVKSIEIKQDETLRVLYEIKSKQK